MDLLNVELDDHLDPRTKIMNCHYLARGPNQPLLRQSDAEMSGLRVRLLLAEKLDILGDRPDV